MNTTQFRFRDFDWLSDKPSDVYSGNDFLGTIILTPKGYVIHSIKGPVRSQKITPGKTNLFKTKLEAADMVFKVWRILKRTEQ